jgi:transcriptional regulator with XRE-family HTH domain
MPKSLRSPRQQRLKALLADVRKARELTQSDVAERLDRPQSFVAKY